MHLTFIWTKQPVSIAVLKKNASYCKNSLVWNFEEQSTKIPRWPCEFKSKEMQWSKSVCAMYCMKSVYIRSFSGPYFPAFELNSDTQSVKPRIKSEWKNTDQENSIHKDSLRKIPKFRLIYGCGNFVEFRLIRLQTVPFYKISTLGN